MNTSRSAAVVTFRLVLLAIAAAAAATGVVVRLGTTAPAATDAAAHVYVCPMHPDATSEAPGDCPICHMELVPKTGEAGASDIPLAEPDTYTIPSGLELRGFDSVLRVRPMVIGLEMDAPASLDGASSGVALFHLDEGEMIQPGEEGLFHPSTGFTPGKPYLTKVRISRKPPVRWDHDTVLVRFDVPPGTECPAGQTGSLKLPARVRNKLAIEESAVLREPEGAYVLVASEDRRTLTKRPVEVGRKRAGYVTILSGLREGEYALAKHTFVLDLERRLARASTIH
jgi:hypothetical protein